MLSYDYQCNASISPRYPIIEALAGIISGFVAWHFGYGFPALAALIFVWARAGNHVYFEATKKIQLEVTTGNALANSMENANVFPSMVTSN